MIISFKSSEMLLVHCNHNFSLFSYKSFDCAWIEYFYAPLLFSVLACFFLSDLAAPKSNTKTRANRRRGEWCLLP